jgi:hypothetical protein
MLQILCGVAFSHLCGRMVITPMFSAAACISSIVLQEQEPGCLRFCVAWCQHQVSPHLCGRMVMTPMLTLSRLSACMFQCGGQWW